MFDYFERHTVTIMSISIFILMVTCLMVDGVKFLEYKTGFNKNLNLFELQASYGNSILSCGALCEEKGCASFLYEVENKRCRIYRAFMTDDDADCIGKYYRRTDAQEYKVIVDTCGPEPVLRQGINVALHKPVTLSSIHTLGVSDGKLMTNGGRGSVYPCASTKLQPYPEAIIDLGQPYEITAVYVVNRSDCCPERLHNLIIQIGNNLANLTTVFIHTGAIGAECEILFNPQHQGQYVKLHIDGTGYLTVCELEVYSSG